jgi:hypothetical protein
VLVGWTCWIGRAGGHKSIRGFEEIRWIWSVRSIRFKERGVDGLLRVQALKSDRSHCYLVAQRDGETLDVEKRCAIRDKAGYGQVRMDSGIRDGIPGCSVNVSFQNVTGAHDRLLLLGRAPVERTWLALGLAFLSTARPRAVRTASRGGETVEKRRTGWIAFRRASRGQGVRARGQ